MTLETTILWTEIPALTQDRMSGETMALANGVSRHSNAWAMNVGKRDFKIKGGFSLVEVAFALGVASFCMVTLLGLIPVGLHNYQQADNQSIMANLTTSVAQDLQATSAITTPAISPQFSFTIPASNGTPNPTPQTVYVDAAGKPTTGPADVNSIYRLSVAFFPPPTNSKAATVARIQVTFPAHADTVSGAWPTKYTSMFETMVSLNRN
jgi:uncharacterized protein (TIGR02598 family)